MPSCLRQAWLKGKSARPPVAGSRGITAEEFESDGPTRRPGESRGEGRGSGIPLHLQVEDIGLGTAGNRT